MTGENIMLFMLPLTPQLWLSCKDMAEETIFVDYL